MLQPTPVELPDMQYVFETAASALDGTARTISSGSSIANKHTLRALVPDNNIVSDSSLF
jgi:hypothetical protein